MCSVNIYLAKQFSVTRGFGKRWSKHIRSTNCTLLKPRRNVSWVYPVHNSIHVSRPLQSSPSVHCNVASASDGRWL